MHGVIQGSPGRESKRLRIWNDAVVNHEEGRRPDRRRYLYTSTNNRLRTQTKPKSIFRKMPLIVIPRKRIVFEGHLQTHNGLRVIDCIPGNTQPDQLLQRHRLRPQLYVKVQKLSRLSSTEFSDRISVKTPCSNDLRRIGTTQPHTTSNFVHFVRNFGNRWRLTGEVFKSYGTRCVRCYKFRRYCEKRQRDDTDLPLLRKVSGIIMGTSNVTRHHEGYVYMHCSTNNKIYCIKTTSLFASRACTTVAMLNAMTRAGSTITLGSQMSRSGHVYLPKVCGIVQRSFLCGWATMES